MKGQGADRSAQPTWAFWPAAAAQRDWVRRAGERSPVLRAGSRWADTGDRNRPSGRPPGAAACVPGMDAVAAWATTQRVVGRSTHLARFREAPGLGLIGAGAGRMVSV